jgi:signal recognition particle subunit SRP54
MLDGLKTSLGDAIKKIVKSSGIDEELIKDLCKDVQRALLTSDVNVRLVLEITKRLEERSLLISILNLTNKIKLFYLEFKEVEKLLLHQNLPNF